MGLISFNRTDLLYGAGIETPSQDAIENTLNLRQVSLEDAVRYGGTVTRSALDAIHLSLRGEHKYTIVDTKVNFLLPGFIPAIPGWHTDGVPRGDELNPAGRGVPRINAQNEGLARESLYHLLEVGGHSKTEFLTGKVQLDLEDGHDLYQRMSEKVDAFLGYVDHPPIESCPEGQVVTWDWWQIHRAVPATGPGWRFLIRVTETDYIEPRTNPSDFIRTQTQVYVPERFGW